MRKQETSNPTLDQVIGADDLVNTSYEAQAATEFEGVEGLTGEAPNTINEAGHSFSDKLKSLNNEQTREFMGIALVSIGARACSGAISSQKGERLGGAWRSVSKELRHQAMAAGYEMAKHKLLHRK
jgi:hypothetical protein